MRRRLLALVVLAIVFTGVAAPASAQADDANTGELRYEGMRYDTLENGFVREFEMDLDFVCVDGVCADDGFFGEFVDGVMIVDLPATGTGCDLENDRRARQGRLELTPEAVTGTVEFLARDLSGCPDGLIRTQGSTVRYELAHVRGDTCLIDASCVAATPEPTPAPAEAVGSSGSGPRDFTEPTVFGGLDTLATAAEPANLVWAAVGTIILALLIAVPTHFFNSAAETLSDRVGAWWRRVRRRPEADEKAGVALRGWPLAAGGVAAAAGIAAFADPAFGFDAAGLRVLLSILVAFGIEVVLGWFAVILLVRRTHPTASATFRFAPLTLLVVAAAVLLTRLTGFEPPIVFGLVAGVAFGGLLGTAEKARVALIGLGWAFGIGMLAWLGYSVAVAAGADVFVRELLATAAIAGISTLPIALLPLRGLAGRTVWEGNRIAWIAAYAIGLFAFLLVLLPLPASWAEVGFGLWAWIGLYALYALAGVAIWLVVTRPWRRTTTA